MSVATELAALRELLEQPRRERINGRESAPEVLDPTPVEIPIDQVGPPTMQELVQQYVRETMSAQRDPEYGSFEEEDDFSEEEPELLDLSGYEITEFDMVEEEAPPVETPRPAEAAASTPSTAGEGVEVAPETEATPPELGT